MSSALVEKATNDFLLGPDWSMNLEICDIINADPGQAKDVIKAIKKRLGNKNSKIQILAMTVLETVIKNCGANVHQQIAEKDVLHEMVKIVKKKADLAARDKAMVLLDSWQEAFGGQQGKYPQYFAAYDELRKMGVEFPIRSPEDDVPIFTPPQSHPINGQLHEQSVEMLGGAETPGDGDPGLSLADMQNARHGLEILLEMLNAADPHDKKALKGELIMELVEQCRSTQQRVTNFVSSTSNEGLLCQALSLNDDLQIVLAKHASLLSGAPMKKTQLSQTGKTHRRVQEEDETEDDFSQLAHRSSSRVRIQTSNNTVSKVPPPPSAMPTKKTNPQSTRRENTVDLLSGDSYDDRQFNQPVAMGNRVGMLPVAAKSLPNDGSHPFSATPQQRKTPVNNSSQYQQQEQHVNTAFSAMTTKKMGQPPFPGFPLPASSSNNPNNVGQAFSLQQQALLYGADMQSILQAQKMQGGYEDSSGWNTSHVAPGDSNQGSRNASDSNQGSARLPPPPIYHAERQQFFHQKRVLTDDQSTEMYSANDIMARTRNLSMDEARQLNAHLTGKQQPDSRLFEELVSDMHNVRVRKQRPPQNPSMGTGIGKE